MKVTMTDPVNHINPEELEKYLRNQMTGKERNAFERKLEGNPFAREAMEGMHSIPFDDIEEDIHELTTRITGENTGNTRMLWLRIAAIFILLIGVSSVFILILMPGLDKNGTEIATRSSQKKIMKQEESNPTGKTGNITSSTINDSKEIASRVDRKNGAQGPMENTEPAVAVPAPDFMENEILQDTIKGINLETGKLVSVPSGNRNKEVMKGIEIQKSSKRYQIAPMKIYGTILSAEDHQAVPGVSIVIEGSSKGTVTDADGNFQISVKDSSVTLLASFIGMEEEKIEAKVGDKLKIELKPSMLALDEIIVSGRKISSYDGFTKVRDKQEVNDNTIAISPKAEDQQAEPETGFPAFNDYVKSQIRFPEQDTLTQRTVVVLDFTIGSNGRPENITVVKSPAPEYTSIATDILQKGPAWKPSRQNGEILKERVRVRMVFRR
ncbi:MAG: carboxypeptidase-like regulatory domain-containing protein [Bacteroidales bacterium]